MCRFLTDQDTEALNICAPDDPLSSLDKQSFGHVLGLYDAAANTFHNYIPDLRTAGILPTEPGAYFVLQPQFIAEGRQLVFGAVGNALDGTGKATYLYRLNLDGSNPTVILGAAQTLGTRHVTKLLQPACNCHELTWDGFAWFGALLVVSFRRLRPRKTLPR